MMDGIDGLAGSMALVSLSALIILFAAAGATGYMNWALIFAVAIVPYLFANLKLFGFKVKEEGTLGSTHQQPFITGFQRTYILVELHLRVIEILHMITIIPAETVIGTKPDESILILHDISHGIARQSRVHRDGTHQRLPHYVSAPGRSRRHRQQEDGS